MLEYETFGIIPLESMACGTPVICSNVGGIKYSVQNGNTGFQVEPNNPDQLVEKIQLLITNPALHQQMKKASIIRLKEHLHGRKLLH
jgi:glycosyltransferase involved in cell wall biosynthesis